MITDIKAGDITSPENHADIIIGMNSKLQDVTGIGLPFVKKISALHPIDLGSVLSFKFDDDRNVHMIICHELRVGGWKDADKYVRFGMDYLWQTERIRRKRKFSVVEIGTGRVGLRDGADSVSIRTAMATSHLPATLFIFNPPQTAVMHTVLEHPMVAYRAWHPVLGEEQLAA